nr:MAG TPA: hypothetical protein [Caudoviricetes sp.]
MHVFSFFAFHFMPSLKVNYLASLQSTQLAT